MRKQVQDVVINETYKKISAKKYVVSFSFQQLLRNLQTDSIYPIKHYTKTLTAIAKSSGLSDGARSRIRLRADLNTFLLVYFQILMARALRALPPLFLQRICMLFRIGSKRCIMGMYGPARK